MRACARSWVSAASRSSSGRKPAGTFASNGNRCSTRSQKAWMVWIFSPPGVSMTRANSFRAASRSGRLGRGAPISMMSAVSASSSSFVHLREPVEHPVGHVGRRRLGEGQAEDARRLARRRAAAGRRAAPAHASCPSPRWRRPRPSFRGPRRCAGAGSRLAAAGSRLFLFGERPFRHAGEMVVVGPLGDEFGKRPRNKAGRRIAQLIEQRLQLGEVPLGNLGEGDRRFERDGPGRLPPSAPPSFR